MKPRSRTSIRVAGTAGLLVVALVVGFILQNVWLGLLLGLLIWLGWFFGFEARRDHAAGVNDDDHGIEL